MFNRAELKSRAKAAFKGKYWFVFAACLVVTAITSLLNGGSLFGVNLAGPTFSLTFDGLSGRDLESIINGNYIDPYINSEIIRRVAIFTTIFVLILFFVVGITSILGAVKKIFVINPLNVGLRSYFMKNRENKAEIKDIFSGFTNGNYMKTVGTVFTTNLFVFLWSLLFVIPGIYHKYVYWLVPYICAERPDISASEARRLSRAMTDGYKLEIFVTELSFIGWRLLANAVIVGNFFIEPYVQATYAEVYADLRDKAISCGKVRPEEVGLTVENIFEY